MTGKRTPYFSLKSFPSLKKKKVEEHYSWREWLLLDPQLSSFSQSLPKRVPGQVGTDLKGDTGNACGIIPLPLAAGEEEGWPRGSPGAGRRRRECKTEPRPRNPLAATPHPINSELPLRGRFQLLSARARALETGCLSRRAASGSTRSAAAIGAEQPDGPGSRAHSPDAKAARE